MYRLHLGERLGIPQSSTSSFTFSSAVIRESRSFTRASTGLVLSLYRGVVVPPAGGAAFAAPARASSAGSMGGAGIAQCLSLSIDFVCCLDI